MPNTSRRTATTGLLWEALAPVVRWPLHSPRRLAALLAALVAIVWAFTALRPSAAADPVPASSTSSSSPSRAGAGVSTVTSSVAASPDPSVTSSSGSPEPAGPVDVAVRFVTVWARPDSPVQAWQVDVIALATPEFGAQLRTVLPENVPARSVTGPPAVTSQSELAAAVTVATDAGPVLVELAAMAGVWKVSAVNPTGPLPSRTGGAGSSLAATYTPLPGG